MADETEKTTDGKAGGVLSKWSWKQFFVYGVCALLVWLLLSGAVKLAKYEIKKHIFGQWGGWIDGPFGDSDDGGFGFDRFGFRGKGSSLDKWIKKNLPRRGRKEFGEVAEVFRTVAEQIDEGEIDNVRAGYAEVIAQLQGVVTKATWTPFLRKLSQEVKKEGIDDVEGLSDVYNRIADAIEDTDGAADSAYLIAPADRVGGETDEADPTKSSPSTSCDTQNSQGGSCPLSSSCSAQCSECASQCCTCCDDIKKLTQAVEQLVEATQSERVMLPPPELAKPVVPPEPEKQEEKSEEPEKKQEDAGQAAAPKKTAANNVYGSCPMCAW